MSSDGKRPRLARGVVLDDRFEIADYLGSGCFSDVYRAKQIVFGHRLRDVAIKLLDPAKVSSVNALDSLNDVFVVIGLQEERPSAQVSRHIIKVYDIGVVRTPEPRVFISMQFVPGRQTLESAVLRFKPRGGMPWEASLMYLRQVLIPLAWMHTLDPPVVHADLKPDNVLMTEDSVLILTDFGLAARLPLGSLGGAIQYQAPETLYGVSAGAEADVYAIGIMWYEMLTGLHPFRDVGLEAVAADNTQAFVRAHAEARKWKVIPEAQLPPGRTDRIVPVSELHRELAEHPALEAILNRCLEFKQSARYPNARLLLDDIEHYIETGAVDVIRTGDTDDGDDFDVQLAHKTPEAMVQDAQVLVDGGQIDEALKLLDSVLKQDPRLLPAMLIKAIAFARAKRFDDARKACQQAQAVYPKEPQVFGTLASVYDIEGRPQLAESMRKQERALRDATKSSLYRRMHNAGS